MKKYFYTFVSMLKRLLIQMKDLRLRSSVYYYLFLLVNSIPSLFLFFTEPYNLSGRLTLVVFPLSLYFILTSLSRRIGYSQLWMLPLFFFHAFQLVVFTLFKEDVVAVDMFLNLATTNASEAGELLGSILIPTLAVCLGYLSMLVATISIYRRKVYFRALTQKRHLLIGILGLVASSLLFTQSKDLNIKSYTLHEDVYPINVLYNMGFAINKWHKVQNYPLTSASFTYAASKAPNSSASREVYVLVIGETARADNWSLYGYTRPTTPLLDKDKHVVCFKDALTQSNTTHKSVSILLAPASAEDYSTIYTQKSLIEAFNEVGFTTVFLSNQARNGSFVEFFGSEADHVEYYRSQLIKTNHLDDVLLTRLQHYIASQTGNLLVVLHTYGSHFNYGERYPNKFKVFTPDEFSRIDPGNKEQMLNAYDNSIRYTDSFLARIGDLLVESGSCASYLYISDHGEDIMDDERNRFLHASPNPTYYQLRVPFISWFSPEYQKIYPDKYAAALLNSTQPVGSNAVFHTFLDVAGIDTRYLKEEQSLVSTQFKPSARMYLGDHDTPVPYYQMNLKEQDKERIAAAGLSKE